MGDEVVLNFLNVGEIHGVLSGSVAGRITKDVGPIALQGANHCMLLHMWNPANATTAPSWEVNMGWWEL